MKKSGKNKTYFSTEKRILCALTKVLRRKKSISVYAREISREAKISSSAFYLHYHSLPDLIEENESKILTGLNKEVRRILKRKHRTLESSYRNILIYLYQYREVLDVCIETENVGTLMKIMRILKPIITEKWNSYGIRVDEKIFAQFCANAIIEITLWKRERFLIDEIPNHAKNLAKITNFTPKIFAQIYYK
ncbi:TetR/AcrR family transcriptional regulator [Candidatus Saccharibacteria bacterium]|nr:TetR/AcrR family transcriptional regulator [Candidatus Saccharibacteria bacterium]